jgi:hypothetical protein
MKVNEKQLRKLIQESITNILQESGPNHAQKSIIIWDTLDNLKEKMSADDILSRLIGRIGADAALKYLKDIEMTEFGAYN